MMSPVKTVSEGLMAEKGHVRSGAEDGGHVGRTGEKKGATGATWEDVRRERERRGIVEA
jgi:hypothetical protein